MNDAGTKEPMMMEDGEVRVEGQNTSCFEKVSIDCILFMIIG
jgi:hypothetical protein